MLKKQVNIDSIMTFIAWLRANDILFLKDYGSVNTNTDTQDLKELLSDFQDDGFLPEELKVEHVIREIDFRRDEINPLFLKKQERDLKENWNEKPNFIKKWEKEIKKEGENWSNV